jgi:hypothetical protein
MTTYRIVGNHSVAGVAPGGTVTDADLEGANIEALVDAGHLEPGNQTKTKKEEA